MAEKKSNWLQKYSDKEILISISVIIILFFAHIVSFMWGKDWDNIGDWLMLGLWTLLCLWLMADCIRELNRRKKHDEETSPMR